MKTTRVMRGLFVSLLAMLLGTVGLLAQTQFGTISGTVVDTSQAMVPGARVSLVDMATNVVREAETNNVGLFLFANVPAGDYQVNVEMQGFRKVTQPVTLTVAQRLDLHFVLNVGMPTQVLTVTEVPTEINTESGDLR